MTSQGARQALVQPGGAPAPARAPRSFGERSALGLGSGWGLLLALLVLLHLAHPSTWGRSGPGLWFPPAGLGLALVAWFPLRLAVPVLLGSGLLVLVQAAVRGGPPFLIGGRAALPGELAFLALDGLLTVLELSLAWWLYQGRAGGARRLSDPRSATQFLLLVPGALAGLFAALRAVLFEECGLPLPLPFHDAALGQRLALWWLDRALGEMILAPPLLVVVTPWLVRGGLIASAPGDERPVEHGPGGMTALSIEPGPTRAGDWVEVAGLAAGAGILCLLLTGLHGRQQLLGWQLWGAPLLLIVWAALRQGPRGGVLVASVSAALPLLFLPVLGYRLDSPIFAFLLQGHLLAQCCAALLVAGSIVWVRSRDSRFGQVVSHVPVVIYSARLPGTGEVGQPLLGAEIALVSAASSALMNCRPEDLLGDHARWLERVHPDDREVLRAALAQLGRQDRPVTCEYRLASGDDFSGDNFSRPLSRLKDSATPSPHLLAPAAPRWLRDTMAPQRDAEGRLIGWEGVVTDVTEQRLLADDLRRTTSMFNALVTNLPTGVFFIQGPEGKPILVNARARQLLGQREDGAASLEYLSRVYRLFRSDGTLYPVEELPVYQALRHGRTTMRDDIVVHAPDGRRVPLVTWAAPVNLGGKGSTDAAVWVLEDRSALHQAEAARQDSEGRLRTVIETMGEGLVVQDRQGTIVDGNPAACALFELPPEGLRGRSLSDLPWAFLQADGAPLPWVEHPAELALRSSRPVRNVVLGLQPTLPAGKSPAPPSQRWVMVNAMPLGVGAPGMGRGAEPAGVVTTFADISAYVHAQGVIRASEESYRGLVESLPLMLLKADRERRVVYCNPITKTITGYEMEEIAEPAAWSALIAPEDLARLNELSSAALAGQEGSMELRYRAKDGRDKASYVLIQPRYEDGQVVGTLSLLVDVTRERQLERELQRGQRLELIGRLSSGVAHDFNNLLSVVLSLADLARGHLPPDHAVHGDLRRITEAGEQAASLAAQMLALSKQKQTAPRRVELNRVVRRTLELLHATLPATLTLDAALADGELCILADETQVQQVVMNLCLNARDAMPGGGTLEVRTALEAGPRARLSVGDTGAGISEQVRARMFEPFFSTKETGTGLGLAVVQQIVESYGGRVGVTSQPGQGARFDVWWPLAGGTI